MVIGELARTARALAAEAGRTVSEPVLHEVEQILHAVLADGDGARGEHERRDLLRTFEFASSPVGERVRCWTRWRS
ncbi:hypothetical protein ACFXDJ_15290 [Streptomyces sp. NPDC059443]|uniref:hypothetical protein n=1 Tax=unclassified Streptomyces TaxID=2593676 RepID=UPI0036A02B4B